MRVQSLALLHGSGIRHRRELWCRSQMQLGLLWLWLWPAAVAPIQPLAWEPPHAASAALKSQKKKKILPIKKLLAFFFCLLKLIGIFLLSLTKY